MNKLVSLYKPIGFTPLELIEIFRKQSPEYTAIKIGYAGRLDPLAHGVLLLMVGDATKERERYLGLDKTYEFEVLFGVETDTYDVLGLLEKEDESEIVKEKVNLFVNQHSTTFQQPYPPYSSKTVNGKPMFWWARQTRLGEIALPSREVTIHSFETLSYNVIDASVLRNRIHETINKVQGDFRQAEILARWDAFFERTKKTNFQTATFRINCSSGTYVRSIAYELGRYLGTGAVALDIKRTRLGTYTLEHALSPIRSR